MKTFAAMMIMILFTQPNSAVSQNNSLKENPDSTGSYIPENDLNEELLLEEIDSGEEDSELLDQLEYLRKHPYD